MRVITPLETRILVASYEGNEEGSIVAERDYRMIYRENEREKASALRRFVLNHHLQPRLEYVNDVAALVLDYEGGNTSNMVRQPCVEVVDSRCVVGA